MLLCNLKMLLSGYKNMHRIAVVNTGTLEYDIVHNTQIVEMREAGAQCFYGLEGQATVL